MDNGAKLTAGWSDAYEVDFTQGGGKGDRPSCCPTTRRRPSRSTGGAEHHARAAGHLLPAGGVRRRAHGRRQPGGCRGRRRLAALARGAGGAADQHVRLPRRRRAPSCRPTGRRTPSSPTSRYAGPGRHRRAPRRVADRVERRHLAMRTSPGSSLWRRPSAAGGAGRLLRAPGGGHGRAASGPTAPSTPAGSLEVLGRPRVHRVAVVHALVARRWPRWCRCALGLPAAHVLYRLAACRAGRCCGRRCWRRSCCRPSWSAWRSAS